MHVAHLILVRAESYEDAKELVELSIGDFHSWSDWAVTGDTSRFNLRRINGNVKNRYVVSYEEERETFESILEYFIQLRKGALKSAKDKVKDIDIDSLELDDDDYYIWLYWLAKLVLGEYMHMSYVYDLENNTTQLSSFYRDIQTGVNNWYGVIVDFHH